jgi:5-methylcytosine-specific restriction endonuclease McrA
MHVKRFVGERFGRLVLVEQLSVGSKARWLCLCDCGKKVSVMRSNLVAGNTKSCGCFRREACRDREWAKDKRYGPVRSYYKRNAALRNLAWLLTDEQFKALIEQNCYYCDTAPQPRMLSGLERTYNGVDRKDNMLGYTTENSVPACSKCNNAKSTMTEHEFIEWARSVAEHTR